ncbi:MAG TPA: peptide transporter [Cyanobacteria bacterium UBA11159]|nr:peptide transporter [Cyanobacteria bacterium UBA11367]HBE58935.1 peptide transporter [Cyanobacteria bacterium UBA11366]HBK65822.1 peptide transporter [Cyanobacteria bacterium UBA11166]HBR75895.1 peptide transporter [Cyanobacteria bacterium UBA11159]
MTDVAKTIQLRFTPLAALLATLWLTPPVKAQTLADSYLGTGGAEVQEEQKIEEEVAGWEEREDVKEGNGVGDKESDRDRDIGGYGNHKTGEFSISPPVRIIDTSITIPKSPLAQIPELNPGGNPVTPSLPPPQDIVPPSLPPTTPPSLPQQLPPPQQLLPPNLAPTSPEVPNGGDQNKITVQKFEFSGNTAFSNEELAKVTESFTNRSITFAELLNARSAITQLYVENGYVTSGAFIPPQSMTEGTIKIEIVEGGLEDIQVNGLRRLNDNYIRSRLSLATKKPLNVPKLLEGLRLLQLNPLIENISAELSTGSGPGTSLLIVEVKEADSWSYQLFANNGRSPSVGSFRRGASLTQANLLGLGDGLTVSWTNTDGSNELDGTYTLPINPRNGTLSISYSDTSSKVIESPFNFLDIQSTSSNLDITLRQPIFQTPAKEFVLGLTASRRVSQTLFLEDLIGEGVGFPAPGADDDGRTRLFALRFFQEWTKRGAKEVFAVRSQFNIGLDAFGAASSDDSPDSRFLSWRGQAQWVRLLAPETLLLIRGDVQLADQDLLPTEQFGLGGQGSVRGYRQDVRLTDNGAFASAELRLPILRIPEWDGVLQVTPFLDLGTTWNSGDSPDPDPRSLAAIGLGLQWQQGDRFTARLDWGIPLISVDSTERTWQENGLYFSIIINPF